ncbi:MAG TPA: hypothetical protein V6D16_16905 [Candidatus Obscuribacterales bacterium]
MSILPIAIATHPANLTRSDRVVEQEQDGDSQLRLFMIWFDTFGLIIQLRSVLLHLQSLLS